ncbi:MAG: proline racemase family protein [Acidobacteriota bacterium]
MSLPDRLEVVDSHTEGEPTRVVIDGWPELASTTMKDRRREMAESHGELMRGVVAEPRGHEAVVAALLTEPVSEGAAAGVVFFNNVGPLWMCGHGLIGVVETLAWLGRLPEGEVVIDTAVGPVGARRLDDGSVRFENVPARAERLDLELEVDGVGRLRGDLAWGGNWFFLTTVPGLELVPSELPRLLEVSAAIRRALDDLRPLGDEGVVDHVELVSASPDSEVNARNFVLCPGGEWDRSPCGTGTSAKLAVLHARGELALGESWVQESLVGGRFVGRLDEDADGRLIPTLQGRAHVVARSTLCFSPEDPFRHGLPPT